MKKILLIIIVVLCIFQMVVLATAIDIGGAAIDRDGAFGDTDTYVCKDNPADGTGAIQSIEIWAYTNMTEVIVVTFTQGDANVFTARDHVHIGAVTSGSKQTFTEDEDTNPISLNVVAGDYIGIRIATGAYERDVAGAGFWYLAGDQTECVDATFTFLATRIISLYGTGATTAEDNTIFFGCNF